MVFIMTTSLRTPPNHTVLQVGPLKPSLERTLAEKYGALVLPDEASARAEFLATHGGEVTTCLLYTSPSPRDS